MHISTLTIPLHMEKNVLLVFLSFLVQYTSLSQPGREDIYSEFALYNKRVRLNKDLHENIILKTFAQYPDSNNEHKFESACMAVSQFMITGEDVEKGFQQLFDQYHFLPYPTKRAFLEAVYGVYPTGYATQMKMLLEKETNPKLFAMSALYLFRADSSVENLNRIKNKMAEQFPRYDSINILSELENYLTYHHTLIKSKIPDLMQLFAHQQTHGKNNLFFPKMESGLYGIGYRAKSRWPVYAKRKRALTRVSATGTFRI